MTQKKFKAMLMTHSLNLVQTLTILIILRHRSEEAGRVGKDLRALESHLKEGYQINLRKIRIHTL